jgi:hypothetical protein
MGTNIVPRLCRQISNVRFLSIKGREERLQVEQKCLCTIDLVESAAPSTFFILQREGEGGAEGSGLFVPLWPWFNTAQKSTVLHRQSHAVGLQWHFR